ncbi:hypothetical protein COOONC_23522 [Cooperia oncophora]
MVFFLESLALQWREPLATKLVNELKTIPGSEHLMFAVNAKKVCLSKITTILSERMDLQKIKSKIADNKYELRQEFLSVKVKRIVDNFVYTNGDNHVINGSGCLKRSEMI